MSRIDVCATSCWQQNSNSNNNRQTNYSLEVYSAAASAWLPVCDLVDTSADAATKVRQHDVQKKRVKQVRVNLRKNNKYFSMKEIDFYVLRD